MSHHCQPSLELLAPACPQDQAARPGIGNSRWMLPCQSRGDLQQGSVWDGEEPQHGIYGPAMGTGPPARLQPPWMGTSGPEQIPCKPRRWLFRFSCRAVNPALPLPDASWKVLLSREQPGQNPDVAAGPGPRRRRAGCGAELPQAQQVGTSVPSAQRGLLPGLPRQVAKLKREPNPAPPFPRAGSSRQTFPTDQWELGNLLLPGRPTAPASPTPLSNGNSISANTCSLYIFLRFCGVLFFGFFTGRPWRRGKQRGLALPTPTHPPALVSWK